MDDTIKEAVAIANLFELVKATTGKVGLEYMVPIDDSRADEIISGAINAAVKGQ